MNDQTSNSVIDPSILFGGASDTPVAPAPVKPAETVITTQVDEITKVEADFVTQQHDPAFATQVNDEGQTELVVQGAPALQSEEQNAHSDPHAGDAENPRATLGDNEPPPEPMDKAEMVKEMWKDIGSYGKASGLGAAALPRLGLRVVRAAADGLISTDKPKDGTETDAVRIYKKYAELDSKHAEHTKGGMKANAAKLNALIGLGCMTMVDGVDVAARTVASATSWKPRSRRRKRSSRGWLTWPGSRWRATLP